MAHFFQLFRTELTDGLADAPSELITLALYGPEEAVDPDDGAGLQIIDQDGDGLISRDEFRDATGYGGLGLNLGGEVLLFDGAPPLNDFTGTLYSPAPVVEGADVSSYLQQLDQNFTPLPPADLQTANPDQAPGTDPTASLPVCFHIGTRIATPQGPRPVELLAPGDLVLTLDHGPQPLLWCGGYLLSPAQIDRRPALAPVRIAPGALGPGQPERPLILSPHHRVLLRSPIAARMFGQAEVLVPARHLTPLPGIGRLFPVTPIHYRHLLLARHALLLSEGAASESLFAGPEAQRLLGDRDLDPGPPARLLVEGARARGLIARHLRNGRSPCGPLPAQAGPISALGASSSFWKSSGAASRTGVERLNS
ncbi:Hint domain-containing protein [Pseudooceanicola sp. CBS1P-1]|uniref:EF-hand domain-containing protein n=1 Tax=Pseudooceanicola albus TaxID=2692189 RepID=A0A6L7G414_9RHOB|nr:MULTISPECIES: Hint domain-containing protein [Pseudooceanicola]MBT9384721.1 Hint domain-containing protein [Pseudooceanicola endophyticus]MXN18422.1 hypothetical protein [Pseudooceanicola albus]